MRPRRNGGSAWPAIATCRSAWRCSPRCSSPARSGPWLVRWDPIEIDFAAALQRPGAAHPFGTDDLGRDVLARVLAATFVDLQIVAVCVVLPFFIGSLIGLASGYFGGWFDRALMRLVDILLRVSALRAGDRDRRLARPRHRQSLPRLRAGRLDLVRAHRPRRGPGRRGAPNTCRRRALLGYSHARMMLRHILPNVITPAIVFMMSDVVLTILAVTSLGFLGLGIQPPTPEWGLMIAEGRTFICRRLVDLGLSGPRDRLRRHHLHPARRRPRRLPAAEGMNAVAGRRCSRSRICASASRRRRSTSRPSTASSFRHRRRRGVRPGRRDRVRQDGRPAARSSACSAARRRARSSGTVRFAGRDLAQLDERAWTRAARQRDRDDLPGPDDLAQPDDARRQPDRRGVCSATAA